MRPAFATARVIGESLAKDTGGVPRHEAVHSELTATLPQLAAVRGGDKVFRWSGGDLRPRRSKIQPVVRRSFVLRTKGSRRDVCRGSLRGGSAICFQ